MSKISGLLFLYALCMAACSSAQKPVVSDPGKTESGIIDGHPAWIMQGNVYEVNMRQYTPEGTFAAFEKHLDRLKDMGVQTLWFMPITPISKVDRKGELGSYYAPASYYDINPDYGTMADWKHLVNTAHQKGFKVLTDWVPNHTGADHPWLTSHPDFYVRDSSGKAISQFDWSDTRKLDYHNPAVADSMIAAMKFWINTGIDGFRCDQGHLVGQGLFWKKAIPILKNEKNILMIGETEDPWMHEEGFDMSYPWKYFHGTVDIAAGKKDARFIDTVIALIDKTFPPNAILMYFTSNHDENSWNKADYGTMPGASHAPFAVLSQTMKRSVPMIYSGQEEPVLDSISFFYKNPIRFAKFARAPMYKTLLQLRKDNPALAANASFRKVNAGDPAQVYSFVREAGNNKVLVITNLSSKEATIKLKDDVLKGKANNVFNYNSEDPTASEWKMEPWGYAVFVY